MELERLRSGDVVALEALLRDAWTPLVRHLTGITGSLEAAQDAAQEAFVRLWEGRERWTAGSPRALLFRIGRNAALDVRRRAGARDRVAAAIDPGTPVTPEQELERRALRDRLDAALATLPGRRRDVFELTWLRGLSYAEAGEVLDVAPQTIANLLSLTLRDLRALLAADPDAASDERPGSHGEAHDG